MLFAPGTLPELSAYLQSDWIDLVGIDARRHDPVESAERLRALGGRSDGTYEEQLARCAELYFHCPDGWWWEMFAVDPQSARAVADHVRTCGGRVEDLDWGRRAGGDSHR